MTATRAQGRPRTRLPQWQSVLAVVAHPDDESFGLGAVLAAFTAAGTHASVLCLTHGEASTLHETPGDLYRLRAREFAAAAHVLGAATATLCHYPDGQLAATCRTTLVGEVADAARDARADGLLTFDSSGLTGHPDHMAATEAALAAGDVLDLAVLGWTIADDVATTLNAEHNASFVGHRADEVDFAIDVDRDRQLAAIAAHASQAASSSVLWRRLELQGNAEWLHWLRR